MFGLQAAPVIVAQEDAKPVDPYGSVWSSLADLLRRREYGTALALLDSLADDANLQYQAKLIEQDLGAIARLQMLERRVREEAAQLKPGTPLEIAGVAYSVVRYDKNMQDEWLILKSRAASNESRTLIRDLHSGTWMQLVEAKRDTLERPSLTLGIFLAFDQSPDAKSARKLFNEAAAEGEDVIRWLARLEEAEARRKLRASAPKDGSNEDPLVGTWRAVRGPDKLEANIEFRRDGTSVMTIPPATLDRLRTLKRPAPTANPAKGKWVRSEGGGYRITNPGGGTVEILVSGDRLIGKSAAGDRIHGLRQAKP